MKRVQNRSIANFTSVEVKSSVQILLQFVHFSHDSQRFFLFTSAEVLITFSCFVEDKKSFRNKKISLNLTNTGHFHSFSRQQIAFATF
jgi:hypothetical protein